YVLITHYHADHVGGVPQLVERIPVSTFIDHGPSREESAAARQLFADYEKAFTSVKRIVVKAGDRVPIRGIRVDVVTAAGKSIGAPMAGAGKPNLSCGAATKQAEDASENAWSLGTLLTFGKFRMIDLGDLTWNKELEIVCPASRIPTVD